jgi:hypothetical protein
MDLELASWFYLCGNEIRIKIHVLKLKMTRNTRGGWRKNY